MERTLGEKFRTLKPRVYTGLVICISLVVLLWLPTQVAGGAWGIFSVVSIAVWLACGEFVRFCSAGFELRKRASGYGATLFLPLLAVVLVSVLRLVDGRPFDGVEACLFAVGALYVGLFLGACYLFVFPKTSIEVVGRECRDLVLGLCLLVGGGGSLILLPLMEGGTAVLGWIILVVASNDTAAYFAGARFGKIRLSPLVSPGKTVIGALSGVVIGSIFGSLFSWLLPDYITFRSVGVMGFVVVLFAQLGDLSVSFLKRSHDVKDSGTLLPGHGGLLDRIDGYLLATPVVLIWMAYEAHVYIP